MAEHTSKRAISATHVREGGRRLRFRPDTKLADLAADAEHLLRPVSGWRSWAQAFEIHLGHLAWRRWRHAHRIPTPTTARSVAQPPNLNAMARRQTHWSAPVPANA
jgi:hypothetical protein